MTVIADPATGPTVEQTTEGLDLDGSSHRKGSIHWMRAHQAHSVCGIHKSRLVEPSAKDLRECPACALCRGILERYLAGHGWDGFGPKPGRDATADLRWEFDE